MCGDVVFCNTSLFVTMCCVCGMRWCRWMMVLGRVPFFLRHSTLFLSTSNTFLLLSNTLLLVSSFFTKPNLFLSRFFCNFTPILSFFFLRIFFLGKVFFLNSLKLKIMVFFIIVVMLWVINENIIRSHNARK